MRRPILHEPWRELSGNSTIHHKPFKDLTDAEKGALLLAHHEGKRIEIFDSLDRRWRSETPGWCKYCFYRIAPEPKTPDTINWEHLSDEVVAIARCRGESRPLLFIEIPNAGKNIWFGESIGVANVFASYRRGTCDWKDSLVIRPGYEDHS